MLFLLRNTNTVRPPNSLAAHEQKKRLRQRFNSQSMCLMQSFNLCFVFAFVYFEFTINKNQAFDSYHTDINEGENTIGVWQQCLCSATHTLCPFLFVCVACIVRIYLHGCSNRWHTITVDALQCSCETHAHASISNCVVYFAHWHSIRTGCRCVWE